MNWKVVRKALYFGTGVICLVTIVWLVFGFATRHRSLPGFDLPLPALLPADAADHNVTLTFMVTDLARRPIWGAKEVQMIREYVQYESPYARAAAGERIDSYTLKDMALDSVRINAITVLYNRIQHNFDIDDGVGPACIKLLLDLTVSEVPLSRLVASPVLINETRLVLVPGVRDLLERMKTDKDPMVAANVDRQLVDFDKRVAAGLIKPLPDRIIRWTTEALRK